MTENALSQRLDALAADPAHAGLHGVVLWRQGRCVLERYFEGVDERWGTPLGYVRFTADTLHDLRSVSKSVVGLLYGIALARGQVPEVDTPLLTAFPEYAGARGDARRGAITVAHVLSMQMGIEWDESLPYVDERNSEVAMEHAPDRIGYVLGRPMVESPGSTFRYCGGATAILAALIARGTGMSLERFAQRWLLEPLGIEAWEWTAGADGVAAAASGLRLRPADLARIGALVLQQGRFDAREVVPAAWVAGCLEPRARVDADLDYGRHWWVARRWNWVAAFGNGGQRLTVLPRADAVLVVTGGNYNRPDAWRTPVAVLTDVVVPGLAG